MLQNALLAFFRVTVRHPLYAALNLLGLSFGIAVFTTLSLFTRFETHFETWLPHLDQIYTVRDYRMNPDSVNGDNPETMAGLLDYLHEDYPSLLGTRLYDEDITVHVGPNSTHETEMLVDPTFLKVLELPLLAGDATNALSSPDRLLISAAMAEKYLGSTNVLGKTLRLSDGEGTHDYTIGGVFATLPANTDFKLHFLRLVTQKRIDMEANWRHWGSTQVTTLLRFQTPVEAQQLADQMDAFVDRKAGTSFGTEHPAHTQYREIIEPLRKRHLYNPQTANSIYTLGLVGILALAIAAINFINLATARAGMRAKEVAVRKALGATKTSLRLQFLGESAATTLIALLIGLSMVELTLPLINSYGGLGLSIDYRQDLGAILGLAGLVMAIGIGAGLYPAMILSSFQPAAVLAASRTPAGGRFAALVREGLVLVQFSTVIAFFIMIAGFLDQLDHLKSADLGFKRGGLLISTATADASLTPTSRATLLEAIKAIPGVTSLTLSDSAPGDTSFNTATNVHSIHTTEREPHVYWTMTGPHYFDTYGAHLLAGRFVSVDYSADQPAKDLPTKNYLLDTPPGPNLMLNMKAVKLLGFETAEAAVGQVLGFGRTNFTVAGVIDDMRFHSPKQAINAMVYFYTPSVATYPVLGLRYQGIAEPALRERIRSVWRTIAPEVPIDLISAEDNLDRFYRPDRNRSHLFTVGAGVAAMIGCIGLYGLAAYNTSRRIREIGLRKVLGASRLAIVRMLVGQFMRPVLVANLIGWPVGYLALAQWLQQFDDSVGIHATYFLAASTLVGAIAIATVAGLAFFGASTEPGKALRYE